MNSIRQLIKNCKSCNFRQVFERFMSAQHSDIDKHRQKIMSRGLPERKPIDGVKNIVLVSSGKGGVGKSTVAVNLAVALKTIEPEKSVGLLDCDVFGPTVPLMMNLHDAPLLTQTKLMKPLVNYGVKCMSMGFLIEDGSPVIWRGLMVMQAITQLTRQVDWGETDYLIVDTPPGTGDTHLSLVQTLPISGVILITTPHSAALQVTKRGAIMYRKLKVPIIGMVDNMSKIICPSCLSDVNLFENATSLLAKELDVEILSTFQLEPNISASANSGTPIVISAPKSNESDEFKNLANRISKFLHK